MNKQEVANGIYVLSMEQMPFYNEFKDIATRNADAILYQVMEFFNKQCEEIEARRAVIGLSGGIDSALTTFFTVKYFGAKNVFVAKMPNNETSSVESISYANLLIEQLGISDENVFEIPIGEAVKETIKGLKGVGIKLDAVDCGNIMARERMKNLYAIARIFGGRVLDTCNKTEILMGYFTVGGDGQSDLNPMGGLFKTWVWELARIFGLPQEIIDKTPSAELEIDQTDEKDMGISYPALDFLLYLRYNHNIARLFLVDKYFYSLEMVNMVEDRVRANRFKSAPTPVLRFDL